MNAHIVLALRDLRERKEKIEAAITTLEIVVPLFGEITSTPDPTPAVQKRMVRTLKTIKGNQESGRNGGVTVVDAFRQVIAGFAGGFSTKAVRDAATAKFPAMADKIESGAGVNIRFLEKKGEIANVRSEGRNNFWKRLKVSTKPGQSIQDLHKQIHTEIAATKSES